MEPVRLGVNVDHVATIREARRGREPDPVAAAVLAELAGADGITVHLRGDRRHIQDRDVDLLRRTIGTRLNLEAAATPQMVTVAATHKPDTVTLVPERREEITTEGGLDVLLNHNLVRKTAQDLRAAGVVVSVFVDPDFDQIKAIAKLEIGLIEINTAKYSEAMKPEQAAAEAGKVSQCARAAARLGLKVLAGHGLNYRNVRRVVEIPEIEELNIGHSIVARASLVGMERAVREMKELMRR
ncbi:MAG: pyridoxine 5'-phosphate synthase [Acidobacteria bacterium]|nr:MAG: pyridoxine 5'-phosphate synthase [Acidobacteria bacterium 13_1_40CM_2_68_10]PYT37250.1 MAG: pyridoxine 5'-phosphate synthase [Acidobacteriota bacterium]